MLTQNLLRIQGIICVILIFSVIYVTDGAKTSRQDNPNRCKLPQYPLNGRWFISGIALTPGEEVSSGTVINAQCDGQFTLDGSSIIECQNGKWNSKIGQCLKLCPPVTDTLSTKVTCTLNGKTSDNCMNVKNGTVATFQCAPFYENVDLFRNPFRICQDGSWNQEIPTCTPMCGVKPKSKNHKTKAYPWNTLLYVKSGKERNYACSGTLINERTILTAAHCVTDEFGVKKNMSLYTVAIGKSSETYKDDQDKEAQYSDLADMFVPEIFKGSTRKYYGDIAVLITKKAFKMTRRVQPVCMDWTNKYLNEFVKPETTWIPGPVAREYYPSLKNITEIKVPLVNETECYDQLSPVIFGDSNFQSLYTPADMYCSGYINSDKVPKCLVDGGAGLITRNQHDNKYYIIGVLSKFPSIHGPECDNKRWTLYTRVSQYISSFISEKSNLFAPINRAYFQTSCGVKSGKATTLILNGKNVTKGDYPWQVALYKIKNSSKELICGGSLINQRVILTAAHCVTDLEGKVLPKESYVAAVGKYYRDYNNAGDTKAQFSSIKHIFIPLQYQGELQNFVGDIAVLVTENSFVVSKQVQPVCVDWDAKYENQFLKPSVTGYVTGWGYTQENQRPSQELKELEVPYIERKECMSKLPSDFDEYFTYDKFCSGFLKEGKSVCLGDSGGGLIFKNPNDDRYYIAGVVSLTPQASSGGCDSHQYSLYTRVSIYIKNFILEKAQQYWA